MAIEVLMPKLGLTMTEGTIEEWKVQEEQPVKKGDVLFSVATDKLTNDVACEADGVLLKILLPAGESAPCRTVVAYLGAAGEAVPGGERVPAPIQAPRETPAARTASAPPPPQAQTRLRISPYARKTAAELGIDPGEITGTGPNGRIVWRDVDAAAQARKSVPTGGREVAGYYTTARISELLSALDGLAGALTLEGFLEKAAARLPGDIRLRYVGDGIQAALPALGQESAVLTAGGPEEVLRLYLAYDPALWEEDAAADALRTFRALLENPLSMLL